MCILHYEDSCLERAALEFHIFQYKLKMLGRSAKSWFHNLACPVKRENEDGKKWPSVILNNQREKILGELDVNKVLLYLVYENVFSLDEYRDVLSHENSKKRAEVFLDKLAVKGPNAFCAFCSVLEEISPHLLSGLIPDCKDQMHKGLPGFLDEEKMRPASELQEREQNQNNDLEWNPFGEDELQESFEEYRYIYLQSPRFVKSVDVNNRVDIQNQCFQSITTEHLNKPLSISSRNEQVNVLSVRDLSRNHSFFPGNTFSI